MPLSESWRGCRRRIEPNPVENDLNRTLCNQPWTDLSPISRVGAVLVGFFFFYCISNPQPTMKAVSGQNKVHGICQGPIDCSRTSSFYVWNSVQSLDRLGRLENMRDYSAQTLFQSCMKEALVSSSSIGRYFHSLMLCIQISSADHDVAHLPRCPEEWFWRGYHGVWHARTIQVWRGVETV